MRKGEVWLGYFILYHNRPKINFRANSISPLKRTETGKKAIKSVLADLSY